jgi:hypothetical protein
MGRDRMHDRLPLVKCLGVDVTGLGAPVQYEKDWERKQNPDPTASDFRRALTEVQNDLLETVREIPRVHMTKLLSVRKNTPLHLAFSCRESRRVHRATCCLLAR